MKTINAIYWRIRIAFLAIQWCFQVNLGDRVWYKGKQYTVYNGVYSESWRIDFPNDNGGWVPRSECIKVKTLRNYIGGFKSGYRFYMTSWFHIWMNVGITPWMRGCQIWPRAFRKGAL